MLNWDLLDIMKKGFLLLIIFLLNTSIFSQENLLPEGWDKILLEGEIAYMNLITGEVSTNFPKKAAEKPKLAEEYDPTIIHKVQKGETLSIIARKYNLNLAQLYRLNSLQDFDNIEIGDEIVIGYKDNSKEDKTYTTKNKENKITLFRTTSNKHIVKSGETLYSISRKYNISVKSIKTLNNLESVNIFSGQVLKIK